MGKATAVPTARRLQETFSFWEALQDDYLIGREVWSLEQTQNGERYRLIFCSFLPRNSGCPQYSVTFTDGDSMLPVPRFITYRANYFINKDLACFRHTGSPKRSCAVTLVGRYFAGERQGNKRGDYFFGNYGQMGMYSLLVIPGADIWHRLPIVRLKTLLYPIDLMTRLVPC
jgi:hypothetical protein